MQNLLGAQQNAHSLHDSLYKFWWLGEHTELSNVTLVQGIQCLHSGLQGRQGLVKVALSIVSDGLGLISLDLCNSLIFNYNFPDLNNNKNKSIINLPTKSHLKRFFSYFQMLINHELINMYL